MSSRHKQARIREATIRGITLFLLVLGASTVAGCRNSGTTADHRTERERDSLIGQSRLPGAHGVRGALNVGDSAMAHRALVDSAANAQ